MEVQQRLGPRPSRYNAPERQTKTDRIIVDIDRAIRRGMDFTVDQLKKRKFINRQYTPRQMQIALRIMLRCGLIVIKKPRAQLYLSSLVQNCPVPTVYTKIMNLKDSEIEKDV